MENRCGIFNNAWHQCLQPLWAVCHPYSEQIHHEFEIYLKLAVPWTDPDLSSHLHDPMSIAPACNLAHAQCPTQRNCVKHSTSNSHQGK